MIHDADSATKTAFSCVDGSFVVQRALVSRSSISLTAESSNYCHSFVRRWIGATCPEEEVARSEKQIVALVEKMFIAGNAGMCLSVFDDGRLEDHDAN